MFAAAALSGFAPAAAAAPEIAVIKEALGVCATDTWSDAEFASHGFKRGMHASLAARGQRVQEYDRTDGRPGISLHSSFILYVACSTGVDLASPEAFAPARDGLIAELGLVPAPLQNQRLSANAKAFMKEYEIDGERDLFAANGHLVAFKFRQFSGRNRMSVFVIRLEKEA